MRLRDHDPITIDQFNGLWSRGDADHTPLDHFADCNNLKFIGDASVGTRDGIGISQDVLVPLQNIKRVYNYPTLTHNTLIVLVINDDGEGEIYHVVDETTVYGPVLTIAGMQDFAFLPYAGRGYISPFAEQLPTTSRPSTALVAALANGTDIETGSHNYAYTFVTATGETIPSPLTTVETDTAGISTPTVSLFIDNLGGGGVNNLNPGETYSWKITYALQNTSLETDVGPISNSIVAAPGIQYGYQISALIPNEAIYVNIYRTLGNGSVYYREYQLLRGTVNNNFPIGGASRGTIGVIPDSILMTKPNPPVSNSTTSGNVDLTGILTGGVGVTARKVYRTEADQSQLKLLTTLNDNVTTSFIDDISDASLGADAPTTNTATVNGPPVAKGLQGEFLYVYAGDGTAARLAAGSPLSGTLTIGNGIAGHTDAGFHLFGFVAETISGYLTAPGALTGFTTVAGNSVSFGTVPTSGNPAIVARHLVATKVITNYNGDVQGYQYFFVPNATINNDTDTFLNNISFFDADLLDDASHLFDNYDQIPAGVALCLYNDRLCLFTTAEEISIGLVSFPGEPEAISQVDGIIAVPPDGNPITNAQELRDVLYVMKRSKTCAFIDNGDVPSTWETPQVVDTALGCPVHGIATVLDSGGTSVDYLIVTTYQGVTLFNGRYVTPELSWKIEDFWRGQDKNSFNNIQILLAPIQKWILIVLPDRRILYGDYSLGMDPKKIRWCPWSFLMGINTIAIWNIDEIILGSDLVTP